MTISTTDTITPACSNCGAIDVGTNFCESCGVSLVAQRQAVAPTAAAPAASATAPPPALAPAAAMPSAPVAGTAADPALGLRVAALVTFLLGLVITGSISVAQATVGNVPASATQWSDTVSAALVALFMLIAAAMARGSDGGTAVGILGALGYAVATPIIDFNTSSLDPGLYAWLPVIPPVFLFMAWAGGRSLKAGWAAVIAVVVIGYFSGKVSPAFGSGAANYEILRDGFFALADVARCLGDRRIGITNRLCNYRLIRGRRSCWALKQRHSRRCRAMGTKCRRSESRSDAIGPGAGCSAH